ncbi:MAG: hypothetical protein GY862_02570 [Gammaproteobacteria bacterium]|nr:hypothetical protein [Gammaproteobacteria bacterium]
MRTTLNRVGDEYLAALLNVLNAAKAHLDSEKLADDVITLKKFVSIAQNLGKQGRTSDTSSNSFNVFRYILGMGTN